MNKSDSERIAHLLDEIGLEQVFIKDKADLLILNTCSVRQKAEDRVLGIVKEWRKHNSQAIIAVTGCLVGRDKDGKLKKKIKDVDIFFNIAELIYLPKILSKYWPNLKKQIKLPNDYLKLEAKYTDKFRAFVPIQTGCNQFCTYCVVPYARGREYNRPVKEILVEIEKLVDSGYKEITLLGQIVNNYQATDSENFSKKNPFKKSDFAKLLWEINQFKNLNRLHWTAPHPLYMEDEVIKALQLPKQINYLHLPVQAGSNKILSRMNRKYTREFYIDLIKKIYKTKPDIAIGTDIIVGFSGETEEDFQQTLDLYEQCQFDISYTAQYSVRSGTVASLAFKDDVDEQIKKERWQRVQDLMEKITKQKNKKYLGQEVEVLVDKKKKDYYYGQSREMKLVAIPDSGLDLIGKIVKVKINKPDLWVLFADKL